MNRRCVCVSVNEKSSYLKICYYDYVRSVKNISRIHVKNIVVKASKGKLGVECNNRKHDGAGIVVPEELSSDLRLLISI